MEATRTLVVASEQLLWAAAIFGYVGFIDPVIDSWRCLFFKVDNFLHFGGLYPCLLAYLSGPETGRYATVQRYGHRGRQHTE
jgi:hypothetical protein